MRRYQIRNVQADMGVSLVEAESAEAALISYFEDRARALAKNTLRQEGENAFAESCDGSLYEARAAAAQ